MLLLLFIFSLFCHLISAYKIGIFIPGISSSQIIFNQRVGDILSNAGHNVTFINIDIFDYKKSTNLTAKLGSEVWNFDAKSKEIDYDLIMKEHTKMEFDDETFLSMILSADRRKMMNTLSKALKFACKNVLMDKEFMHRMEAAKFDIVFAHMVDFCPIGIQHAIKVPTWVWISSGPLIDYMANYAGLYVPPSYAGPVMADMGDKLTFIERFKSIIGHTISPMIVRQMSADDQTEYFRQYIDPNFPDLVDLAKTVPLIFVNSNELYDLPRPTLHKIINIGGIEKSKSSIVSRSTQLPEEYSSKIEKSKNIVIFTFGSVANASAMPLAWKNAFMKTFANFPETQFFVQYGANDLEAPANVYLNKWLPQVELLQHPKTRAFITHGGYNGLQEALSAAKPLLLIPLFGDQFRNSRIVEKHNCGIVLAKSQVTESHLMEALKSLLYDKKYLNSMERMNQMLQKKPIQAETLLIRWTEFVAEFKNLDNLKPMGASMDSITYYNIDVYAFVGILIGFILFIFYKICAFVFKKIIYLIGFNKQKVE